MPVHLLQQSILLVHLFHTSSDYGTPAIFVKASHPCLTGLPKGEQSEECNWEKKMGRPVCFSSHGILYTAFLDHVNECGYSDSINTRGNTLCCVGDAHTNDVLVILTPSAAAFLFKRVSISK
ncbi:hypothetical protein CEXT_375391 [Caerostris extrusa]|uniref:Uncharacterized protein n=1 Tax=Caerostris extrusa TaxID=172846 RepID=A0AAV4XIA6_CAEEX|nr:hypothetical protein CEXT_375391 [Caerostris extrusa]